MANTGNKVPIKDHTATGESQSALVRAVAVGNPKDWQEQGHALPSEGLAFVGFHEVTEVTLDYLQPTMIFSPVLAKGFDCIDLALTLNMLGYSGEYRAIAIGFPKPAVIEREVKQLCPQLDFAIIEKL